MKDIYKNDIDEGHATEEDKFKWVSGIIKGNPDLNAAVRKYLPDDYTGMLMADGFFDQLSDEEAKHVYDEILRVAALE